MLLVCKLCLANSFLLYKIKTKYNPNKTAATIIRETTTLYLSNQELPGCFVFFLLHVWRFVETLLGVSSSGKNVKIKCHRGCLIKKKVVKIGFKWIILTLSHLVLIFSNLSQFFKWWRFICWSRDILWR